MALFGGGGKTVTSYEAEAAKVVTLIGKGAVCHGDFTAPDSARIDGEIKGDVTINGALIIGASGKVNGEVRAINVFIAGEVHGNVDASDGKLELSDTGTLIGNVRTRSIVIDENAHFQGNCTMTHVGETTQGGD